MRSMLRGIASEVLQILVPALSDAVRTLIVAAVEDLENAAQSTENEYDDALVDILRSGIDVPEKEEKGG